MLSVTTRFTARALLATAALTTLTGCASRASSRAALSPARSDRSQMLVSTAWLAEHADDADVVLLHVGSRAQYDSGHVAGARFVALADVSEPQVEGGLTLQMASVPHLTAWANGLGIGDRTRVVVIPHDDALQSATRVFLVMAYLGAFERTSLLNGSMKAWKAEGRPITTEPPRAPDAARSTFTPEPRPEIIASLADVEAIAKDSGATHLIDARLPRYYNGDGGGYPRPGHIPTAVNIPLSTVSSNGFVKPASELKSLFDAAGVTGAKPIVTYCHIGQQATVLWFVATLLGYDARMFDGSFQQWSGTTRLPVVSPKAKP
jgi:thiosulfate/3-mercaptopyruvate sulfurtransferase